MIVECFRVKIKMTFLQSFTPNDKLVENFEKDKNNKIKIIL